MSNTTYEYTYNGLSVDRKQRLEIARSYWMHVHNEYELLYILSGDIIHGIEDRKYHLQKHDLVIVRPNDYHYIQIEPPTPYERYDILFDPDILGIENIHILPKKLDVLNCRHKPIIAEIFKKIDYYHEKLTDEQRKDVICLLLKELIYNLSFESDTRTTALPESIHPVVSKALAEINDNLFTIRNVEEIADKLYVSKGYLFRIFKRELKTTPLKYITEKRLHAAQSLLAQGKPPTYVYRECGFNDYTSFYRSYVKLFGHAPSK